MSEFLNKTLLIWVNLNTCHRADENVGLESDGFMVAPFPGKRPYRDVSLLDKSGILS